MPEPLGDPSYEKLVKRRTAEIYEVKKGDTFQSIAKNELGNAKKDLEIIVLNGKKEDSQPTSGELIKIIRSGKFKKNKIRNSKDIK